MWSHHITTPLLTKQWWLEIITGCVMVTTLDIIVQHPLNQYDTDCTTALHIEPTILLCLCYCCWFSYCWLWNFFVVLLWAWISTPVERIKVSALVYSFALVLSMGIPIDKPLSLINIAKKKNTKAVLNGDWRLLITTTDGCFSLNFTWTFSVYQVLLFFLTDWTVGKFQLKNTNVHEEVILNLLETT